MYMYIYVCVYRILIQSSVDEYLGCFHVLAIVTSAAVNTGVHISFQTGVLSFSGYIPRSAIAGSYGSSTVKESSILFSIVAAPIYIPTNSVWGFPFLYILSSIYYL